MIEISYHPFMPVLGPWQVRTENSDIFYTNDGFIEYISSLSLAGLDNNSEEQLKAALLGYNLLEEKLGYFFVRDRRSINQVKSSMINRLRNIEQKLSSDNQCHAFCFCKNKQ